MIETLNPPKSTFYYQWTCGFEPCGARLQGTIADAQYRSAADGQLGFECPHCARRTNVPLHEGH